MAGGLMSYGASDACASGRAGSHYVARLLRREQPADRGFIALQWCPILALSWLNLPCALKPLLVSVSRHWATRPVCRATGAGPSAWVRAIMLGSEMGCFFQAAARNPVPLSSA